MKVKCLAQKHNILSPARARTRTPRYEDERTNHEANTHPIGANCTFRKMYSALDVSPLGCFWSIALLMLVANLNWLGASRGFTRKMSTLKWKN